MRNIRVLKRIITAVMCAALSAVSFSCADTQNSAEMDFSYPLEETVFMEAGDALPGIDAFLTAGYTGTFITDMSAIDASSPGTHEITIEIDGENYSTYLVIEDTAAPEAKTRTVLVKPGGEVSPEDFFSEINDATHVTCEFASPPDTSETGAQDVNITVTDEGGNTVSAVSRLIVSNISPVTVEARKQPLSVSEVTDEEGAYFTQDEDFLPDTVGEYEIPVMLESGENIALVTVEDTTPPAAEPKEMTWFLGHEVSAEKMVENAFDLSLITYSYKTTPDWSKEGAQEVTVVMTDASGNTAEVTSSLTLVPDSEAPSLYGLQDEMYFYMGGTIAYLDGVYAEDNCDSAEEIDITVDSSGVDIYTLGKYEVVYTATDTSGNSASKTVTLQLVKQTVTQEQLDAEVERTLAEITDDSMSIGEKAYAIYNYIRGNMVYTDSSDKTDYIKEAYNGLTKLRGDCFTFYAATDALLRAIGAETMMVSRQYNTTRPTHHYWVLCNLGTGWYHIDTCNTGPRNFEAFMRTDDEFTTRARTFWMFDHSLYPSSPTQPYEKDF